MTPRERIIETCWGTFYDACFMAMAVVVAIAIINTKAPLWVVLGILLAIIAVCNWWSHAPDTESDDHNDIFPGGPPAAA